MSTVKTAEEIGKLHALCEKAFADESGYGEVHSLSDRGIYRTFRDGFFAANRVLGKELRAELAELRARAGELERQVRDKHEAATVDEICNAYESGVGHRGRPTANVNPYRQGTAGHVAYRLGATGTKHNAPQDDARDAERYRYIRDKAKDGAVKMQLPLYRAHYFVSLEPISECPTFDAAIDAAILAAKVKP